MGGGVMRAAAKLAGGAGVGVVTAAGLRGSALPVEHQVFSSASRKSYSPISSALATVDGSSASVVDYSTQRSCRELEEWEFAGVEEELNAESGKVLPRVVFGGVPTKDEAEVATLELKDALEKVLYPGSSDSNEFGGKSVLSNSGHSSSFASGGIMSRSAQQPALQAFKFLSSSPEAQNVVVSIVSDQNVWGAVFKNEAFVEYLESQRGSTVTSNEESDAESVLDVGNLRKGDIKCSHSQQSTEAGSFFKEFVDTVKISVTDLANTVSDFFQNVFGGGVTEKKAADAGDPTAVDRTTIGSYIMGIAIMVITLVVLKRV